MSERPIGAVVPSLPGWMLAGVALGGVLAGLVALTFVIGVRVFPDPARGSRGGDAGEERRRAEIREYLRSIGEPFLEDHAVAGRRVAFYLPKRGVAITYDAKEYFVLERAGVHAVLIEYELPGASLGSRLPFATPATADDDRVARAYARLGLAPSADDEAVRAAYRDRVKATHPDHGGDLEAFRALREAYTVARSRAT